jgi:ornithine cyclodeaminase/alanine dehydrogenase-like protein (mu-crystallin family)
MTLTREAAQPLAVDSFEVQTHVGHELTLSAAREAALAVAGGEVACGRVTLPFDGGWMRIMGAVVPSLDLFGYKEFHLAAENTVRYAVHLFRLSDGAPLGVVDGALVTPLRTAATAAVASEWFFGRGRSVRLAVVGSGAEAQSGVRALDSVLALKYVSVSSRSQDNRDRCAEVLRTDTGLAVSSVASIHEAVDGADMVYVATNSGGAVVATRDDLRGVPFVASIGSTLPIQRELHGDVLAGAACVVVDTWDVLEESGDAIDATGLGLSRDRVMLLGGMRDRSWQDGVGQVVYKSIGSPEQDLVLAHRIIDAAQSTGDFGRPMEPLSTIKQNL